MSKTINEIFSDYGLTLYTDSKLSNRFSWFEEKSMFDELVNLVSSANENNLNQPDFRLALKKQVSLSLFFWNYVVISDAEKWKLSFGIPIKQFPYSDNLLGSLGIFGIKNLEEPLSFYSPGFILPRLSDNDHTAVEIICSEICPAYKIKQKFLPEEANENFDREMRELYKRITPFLNSQKTDLFLEKLLDAVVSEWQVRSIQRN